MDAAQAVLFDAFPRRVGTPNQHWVFSRGQFDHFVAWIAGRRNAYATVGQLHLDGTATCDKVFYDFDGDKSGFADDMAADERIALMRRDPDVADDVLGEVVADARALARESAADGIPVVGVFSGFGVHVHQLYQPTDDPAEAMASCVAKYDAEVGFETLDWDVVGQPDRLCRVPNAERATTPEDNDPVVDGRPTGCYQVPLDGADLRTLSVADVLELSREPRPTDHLDVQPDGRPQMPVWTEHLDDYEVGETVARPVDERTQPLAGDVEGLLADLLQMPCMVERITQPNPEHFVRFNAAVMLFNVGLDPQSVADLFGRIGWVDFDRQKTLGFLEQIYDHGYSDASCRTLRGKALCVRTDDPGACPCYGWGGGSCDWREP